MARAAAKPVPSLGGTGTGPHVQGGTKRQDSTGCPDGSLPNFSSRATLARLRHSTMVPGCAHCGARPGDDRPAPAVPGCCLPCWPAHPGPERCASHSQHGLAGALSPVYPCRTAARRPPYAARRAPRRRGLAWPGRVGWYTPCNGWYTRPCSLWSREAPPGGSQPTPRSPASCNPVCPVSGRPTTSLERSAAAYMALQPGARPLCQPRPGCRAMATSRT